MDKFDVFARHKIMYFYSTIFMDIRNIKLVLPKYKLVDTALALILMDLVTEPLSIKPDCLVVISKMMWCPMSATYNRSEVTAEIALGRMKSTPESFWAGSVDVVVISYIGGCLTLFSLCICGFCGNRRQIFSRHLVLVFACSVSLPLQSTQQW